MATDETFAPCVQAAARACSVCGSPPPSRGAGSRRTSARPLKKNPGKSAPSGTQAPLIQVPPISRTRWPTTANRRSAPDDLRTKISGKRNPHVPHARKSSGKEKEILNFLISLSIMVLCDFLVNYLIQNSSFRGRMARALAPGRMPRRGRRGRKGIRRINPARGLRPIRPIRP